MFGVLFGAGLGFWLLIGVVLENKNYFFDFSFQNWRLNMYYSNCLVEAIKYKLKDWKNVRITYIPARYNEVYCPHFMWSDGKNDYDFETSRYLKWYERLWFKGEVKKRELGWNARWKAYRKTIR